jgi:hypothetical protein
MSMHRRRGILRLLDELVSLRHLTREARCRRTKTEDDYKPITETLGA